MEKEMKYKVCGYLLEAEINTQTEYRVLGAH
jgi:hypothetical protein